MLNNFLVVKNTACIYYFNSLNLVKEALKRDLVEYYDYDFGLGWVHKNLISFGNQYDNKEKKYLTDFSKLKIEKKYYNYKNHQITTNYDSKLNLKDGLYYIDLKEVALITPLNFKSSKPQNLIDKVILQNEYLTESLAKNNEFLDILTNTLTNILTTITTSPVNPGSPLNPSLTTDLAKINDLVLSLNSYKDNKTKELSGILERLKNE